MKTTILSSILILFLIIAPANVKGADTKLFFDSFSNLVLDGSINSGEYVTTFGVPSSSDGTVFLTVSWSHNGTHIALGIQGTLTGYIGFGMNEPGKGMAGADMVIASVEGNSVTVGDYHATGNVPPVLDNNQFPIDAVGKEEGGDTTIEMVFPLSSDDSDGQDHSWEVGGTYGFFFAAHETSDDVVYHTWRSNLLTLEIAPEGEAPAQQTVTLGDSSGENIAGSQDLLSPILFWGFLASLGILVWKNGKYY